jgi:hypothetical protein
MAWLSQMILECKLVSLHLRGTIDLLTHGVRVSNLLFEKTIVIEGKYNNCCKTYAINNQATF